jgi:micrococcal nuclease|tara:strand:+ start:212 stop:673 length:462 start_codon:yes stop_codon:yes gene_type:complete
MLKPISLILVSMIGIAVVVVAVQNPPEDGSTQSSFSGTITKITDGDTLDFRIMNGPNITIRLSLVDTPELEQPGYEEASNFAATVCPVGSDAVFVQDSWQKVDKYGRSLGLIYCNDMMLNEMLLSSGHADIFKIFCDESEFGTQDWAVQYGCS